MQRRGDDYELIYNGVFLMASYNGRGEQEMVGAALQPWYDAWTDGGEKPFLEVLIGGLGFGLGLREALTCPMVKKVDLLELEEAVIRWNRGVLRELNGCALEDVRVNLFQEDAVHFLQNNKQNSYHAIIMDTDNGPDWLSREANSFLYSPEGTGLLQERLIPGGTLSVWSAAPVPAYYALLQQHFSSVHEAKVLEKTGLDSYYYLAVKLP